VSVAQGCTYTFWWWKLSPWRTSDCECTSALAGVSCNLCFSMPLLLFAVCHTPPMWIPLVFVRNFYLLIVGNNRHTPRSFASINGPNGCINLQHFLVYVCVFLEVLRPLDSLLRPEILGSRPALRVCTVVAISTFCIINLARQANRSNRQACYASKHGNSIR
jgi:hypothetical protein